jgi:uncharacterized tellurite resistance protein B-like protein
MLGKLLDFFKPKPPEPSTVEVDRTGCPVTEEVLVALLVILVEMSGRDGHIADEEAHGIVELMVLHFGVSEREIVPLLQRALEQKRESAKIDPFVAVLNDTYNDRQRQLLLAMLWRIVCADGEVEGFEKKFAVQMKFRFRLSEELAEEARHMALEGRV